MAERTRRGLAAVALLMLAACGGEGFPIRVTVPPGAHMAAVADTLADHGIIDAKTMFRLYARVSGAANEIKPGVYAFRRGESWNRILDALRSGRVLTYRLTIPEGWDLRRISARIGRHAGQRHDTVYAMLMNTATPRRYGVPGPTMEGYLYPATYALPVGTPVDTIVLHMVREYRKVWTPERLAKADSIGMTEKQVVTLASIIEKEARVAEEMPRMAAVYRNRLRIGMALYADPTVQYALGEHQRRLLYKHIDKVEDHPYNTYTHPGLPPGPISSPSARAVDAVLHAPQTRELYFVARHDGTHLFSRTLAEHNQKRAQVRREAEAARRGDASTSGAPGP